MSVEELILQTRAYMSLSCPELGDCAGLIEECMESAQQAFTDEFICQMDHRVWAKITLNYHQQFLQTGCDISVGQMLAESIRDSIRTNRIDFLTQELAQQNLYQQLQRPPLAKVETPCLHIVPDDME